MARQGWVDELAVKQAGPLGVGGKQPQHEGHLDLVVEREPVRAKGVSPAGEPGQGRRLLPTAHLTPASIPGNKDVCEGLHRHEERKDDPVHHPPDLGAGWGRWQRGQKPAAEPAVPTPLSQADPARRFQKACPTAFPWHLAALRELPLRNCHSFLYPPPTGFTHKILQGTPIAHPPSTPTLFQDMPPDYRPLSWRPAQTPPTSPNPTTPPTAAVPAPEPSPLAHSHTHIFTNVLSLHSLVGSIRWVQHPKHQPEEQPPKQKRHVRGSTPHPAARWPLPPGFKTAEPALFFPLGLHNLHLSQCPGGRLPTRCLQTSQACPGLQERPIHGCVMQ